MVMNFDDMLKVRDSYLIDQFDLGFCAFSETMQCGWFWVLLLGYKSACARVPLNRRSAQGESVAVH